MDRWQNRVALVTGASVGIGAEICRALVQHGMVVVGCARSVDKIKAIAEEVDVKLSPGKLVPIKCDLTKECEILALFDEIRKTFGRLDVCINNAGLAHDSPLLTGSASDFRNMLDVNVMALCICTQQAVKLMQEKKIDYGQIINIGSIAGHHIPKTEGAWMGCHFYCGTKFMVRGLTEGLRRELKALKTRIRISSVSPGLVETEFFDQYFKGKMPVNPLDLFDGSLKPRDVADSILYILRAPPHVEVYDVILQPVTNPA